MSASNDSPMKIDVPPAVGTVTGGDSIGILQRWKEEDMLNRGLLGLRGVALCFSLISFILVASNQHGGLEDFEIYQQYRYLLGIAILSSIYTGGQVFRQIHELSTVEKWLLPRTGGALIDFVGDQVAAYLLISSASSAIPITDIMRKGGDNLFTDSSAAAISMSFLAFICLALSALTSGYKLSVQSYI